MNQLLWFYADLERETCEKGRIAEDCSDNADNLANQLTDDMKGPEHDACLVWRRFSK